jgi:hypothetical protein
VRHFRSASSYIAGHRDTKVLVVLPGEVIVKKEILVRIVDVETSTCIEKEPVEGGTSRSHVVRCCGALCGRC